MSDPMINERDLREVAIAILYQQGRFLLQLRDDIPEIVYSGRWGLFGGHLEAGETADIAIQRELQEEISYVPPQLVLFGQYPGSGVMRHVYHAEVIVPPSALVLGEGRDMGWFTPDEIRRDECCSGALQQIKPIGTPHRKILLDFFDKLDNSIEQR